MKNNSKIVVISVLVITVFLVVTGLASYFIIDNWDSITGSEEEEYDAVDYIYNPNDLLLPNNYTRPLPPKPYYPPQNMTGNHCYMNCSGFGFCNKSVSTPYCICETSHYGSGCQFTNSSSNYTNPSEPNCMKNFNCTGHGSCLNGTCFCFDGYQGNDCSIHQNYTLNATCAQHHNCSGHGSCYDGHCNCYTHWSGPDCGTFSNNTNPSLCPRNCSGHGSCMNGTCFCFNNFTGSDCSQPVKGVNNTNEVYTVDTGDWLYFRIFVPSESHSFDIFTVQYSGDVDIYVQKGQAPNWNSYINNNVGMDSPFNLYVDDTSQGFYYIGYYGFIKSSFSFKTFVEVTVDEDN
eukprot:TRINITY_DN1135_c0_g1_i1.p1 TRINITY_DN1135_c0_g1~~TRINITY_DN1135_c0_g1_i1.p1  ORF type:complete len:346 (+),score=88.90 TRINITY_DN1135_c0_g1_i1:1195-2232(+)